MCLDLEVFPSRPHNIFSRFCQQFYILSRSHPKLSRFVPFPQAKPLERGLCRFYSYGPVRFCLGVFMLPPQFPHTQRLRSPVTDSCLLLLLDNYVLLEHTNHFFLPLPVHISVSSLPHSAIKNSSCVALCCLWSGRSHGLDQRFPQEDP